MSQEKASAGGLPPLVATLSGRVFAMRRSTRRGQTVILTVLKLPAPDQFSSPETVEVVSGGKLGDVGSDWSGKVRIGGYGRTYRATDPSTGTQSNVQTADNGLTVVE